MTSIRYRSCTIEGTRADAVLAFKESVSDAIAAIKTELDRLSDLTAQRVDESVVLVGQEPSKLVATPTPGSALVAHSLPGRQGTRYRSEPARDRGAGRPGGRGGLIGTYETALAQWVMEKADGSAYGSAEPQLDSGPFLKTAKVVGTLPSGPDGPIGKSRVFDGSSYLTVPTKKAILGLSESQLQVHGAMGVWGWVKPIETDERVVCSFSSPAATSLAGQATLNSLSASGDPKVTMTSVVGIKVRERIAFALQPTEVYEVVGISGLTITLHTPYTGTLGTSAVWHAYPFPPEARNTLYGLSVTRANNKVRAYWQYGQNVSVEVNNSEIDLPADQHIFVGFQRYDRKLSGTCSVENLSVTGVDTNFVTEFGYDVTQKWIKFDGDDRYYKIGSVTNNTTLTLAGGQPKPKSKQYDSYYALRTSVHVGTLDGTFSTVTVDHLPGPTGGSEPDDDGNSKGNFFIGHDESRPSRNFIGDMNALTFYPSALDTTDASNEAVMRAMYNQAFPDYVLDGDEIRRSPVSNISDGGTVLCSYPYGTSLAATGAVTDEVVALLDDMLVGVGSAKVKTVSQLANTIGAPDPAWHNNQAALNRLMPQFGFMVANGQPLIRGRTDIKSYAALVKTVGSVEAADKLIVGKPRKAFILVAITEDVMERMTIDSCGRPTTTVEITERIVGINRNLNEAAVAAGFSSPTGLKLKLWWLGEPGNQEHTVLKMRNLGMTASQITDAMSMTESESLKLWVIPFPEIGPRIRGAGVSTKDLEDIVTVPETPADAGDPPTDPTSILDDIPTNIPINPDPTTDEVALVLQTAIAAPGGVTVDGDPSPLDPGVLVAATVDLGKCLDPNVGELFPDELLAEIDSDCAALVGILDFLIEQIIRAISQVNAITVPPFLLKLPLALGAGKLALGEYIGCVANVSPSFYLPPFKRKINETVERLRFLNEQASVVSKQVEEVGGKVSVLLCIPRTLLAALRGGVCGIETPAVIANRNCPNQLDLLLDKLEKLIETIELMLRRLMNSTAKISVDIDFSIGAASKLEIDSTIPCIGPVAKLVIPLTPAGGF